MNNSFEKICVNCGTRIDKEARFCSKCGAKQFDNAETQRHYTQSNTRGHLNSDWLASILLCFFVGTLGIHIFYNGKIASGVLMLITFGGLGVWYIIDLILIITENFTDKKGEKLRIYN
ncbi:MAG: TM2 domain-containing protein [Bacteroidales bacterium]|nr:TM2 domain-containing protein [Bacteroidales bacterium]